MSSVGSAAVGAGVRALLGLAKKGFNASRRRKIIAEAQATLIADQTERFVEHLSGSQAERLHEFVSTPEFGQLVLQAYVDILQHGDSDLRLALRSQVWSQMRLRSIFTNADLVQATDVMMELMYSAALAIRNSSKIVVSDGHALRLAAHMATAAARNGELLTRIDHLRSINNVATQLRGQVARLHDKMQLPNVIQSRSIEYGRLYVEPQLSWSSNLDASFSMGAALDDLPRLVILGDPGAGKSTLAKKLAHDLATARDGLVPFLIIVRDHIGSLHGSHETLVRRIADSCKDPYGVKIEDDAIEYLLLNGRAILIIDGLDELGDSALRVRFTQSITAFAQLYPLSRIVVTSRVVGYEHAALDGEQFPTMRVAPFESRQVEKYAHLWFALDRDARQAAGLADSFARESRQIQDLRSNPLMLSLLCVLYSSEHSIPQNRPEIYERCAEILFDTWDQSRGIRPDFKYRSIVKPAVQQLAWKLFTDPARRQALPREEMVRFLANSVFSSRFDSQDEAAHEAALFLQFCHGRAWVLTDVGSDALRPHYGFTHRTFLEYFAAGRLVREDPRPEVVWNALRGHLHSSTWTVVAHLAVQILDRSVNHGADQIFEIMLRSAGEGRLGRFNQSLNFALQLLESVAPSAAILKTLATAAVEQSCRYQDRFRWSNSRKDPIAKSVDYALYCLLMTSNPENRLRLVDAAVEVLISTLERRHEFSSAPGVAFAITSATERFVNGDLIAAGIMSSTAAVGAIKHWEELWRRPSSEAPSMQDIGRLYQSYWACNYWVNSDGLAFELVGGATYLMEGDALSVWDVSLARLLPALLKGDIAALQLKQSDTGNWYHVLANLRIDYVEKISPDARAALLLLLVPLSTVAPLHNYSDRRISSFLLSRRDPSKTEEAVALVNRLAIPGGAHRYLIDWLLSNRRRQS